MRVGHSSACRTPVGKGYLAGPLALTLLSHFLERHWLHRAPSDRALSLTPAGRRALGWWPV